MAKEIYRETEIRSLFKAISYRLAIVILDFTAVYLLTKKTEAAISFVIISNIYTTVAYYLHERIWNRIDWGRRKPG